MNTSPMKALLEERGRHLLQPLHDPAAEPSGNVWIRGEGCTLIDADGNRYLDGMSGLWNVTLGHGRHELIDAAHRQLLELAYCSGYAGSTNTRALELADRLSEVAYPSINRFFFTSGGAESNDSAIKMARYYWKAVGHPKKTKIISLLGGYHGVTLAAMCATGMPSYWPAFEPRMPGFVHIPCHDLYRYEAPTGKNPETAAADELETAILKEDPETVALFLIEPVLGAGAYVPPAGYFRRVREICDRYGVLLAADEVITGFGRTGTFFGLEHWGVEPDIVQFAKGITSGYFPLGGIGFSDRISEILDLPDSPPWMHCFTYSGHPVACAVALATLDVLKSEQLVTRAKMLGERLNRRLRHDVGQHPNVGDIRGLGLLMAIELVEDRSTKRSFDPARKMGARVLQECRKRGLVTRGRGDTIYIGPPLVATDADADSIADTLAEAVTAVWNWRT
jgi:4-aminobutyrate---pyruvate transaminase